LVRIAYIYHTGRLSRIKAVRDSKMPTDFFYGAVELQRRGDEIGYFEIDLTKPPGIFGGLFNLAAAQGMLPEKLDGAAISQTFSALERIRGYDCVVATTSAVAFAWAFWKVVGFACPPIVAIHCGLFNNPYSWLKKGLTRFFLKKMVTVLFGESETAGARRLSPQADIRVVQFGVDVNFWFPGESGGTHRQYILAVGNDGRRDYETLIEAAKGMDCPCRILTRMKLPEPLPPNVEHIQGGWHTGGITDAELRELYRNAACVVVPLIESEQPSGQSVTLQAMACGTPVVLTETKGLWSREMMKHDDNVLFVPPGDAEAMKSAVNRIVHDASLANYLRMNALRTIQCSGNISSFAQGVREACVAAMNQQG